MCERQYRPAACGAVHINCGVRCVNDGGAARLYSQPGLVIATRSGCIVDGYTIRSDSEVSGTRSHARGVSEIDGVNTGKAGGNGDIDTRLKREVDAEAAGTVVGIVGDGTIGGVDGAVMVPRRAAWGNVARIASRRGVACRRRRFRYAQG